MFVLLDFDVVIGFLLNLIFVKNEEIYNIVVLHWCETKMKKFIKKY